MGWNPFRSSARPYVEPEPKPLPLRVVPNAKDVELSNMRAKISTEHDRLVAALYEACRWCDPSFGNRYVTIETYYNHLKGEMAIALGRKMSECRVK